MSAALKPGCQLLAASMQPGLDCPFRTTKTFGDFGTRELFLIKKQEAFPQVGFQLTELQVNFFRKFSRLLPCRFGDLLRSRSGKLLRGDYSGTTATGQGRATAIGGNRQNPGTKRTGLIPMMQAAKSPHKGFLNDVLGVLVMSEYLETQSIDRIAKSLHE